MTSRLDRPLRWVLVRHLAAMAVILLAVVGLAVAIADRIAVLYHGRLVEEGSSAEVLGAPRHPYTRRLLASLPVPDPVEQAERREALRHLPEEETP